MISTTWRQWCWGGLVLAMVAVGDVGVRAQDEGETGGAAVEEYLSGSEADETAISEYITLDVREKPLADILKFVSRRVGVNVVADPEVDETVTIQLDSVDWRDALEVLAKQADCQIVVMSDRLIRFTQPPSISMEFQDADIKVVLELLAKQAGANIMMNADIQGKVSLSLREVPWQEALSAIVKTAGYVIVREETLSGKEILRVVRPESLKQQLETRHFQLRYIRPADPYEAIMTGIEQFAASMFSGAGGSGAFEGGGAGGSAANFTLETALKNVVSEEGSLDYDEHTNTFIVKDIKPKLDEIQEIIERVDVQPPQIYVEVKFISTSNSDILERGIRFDLANTPERDGFLLIARGGEPGTLDPNDPFNFIGGTFPFNLGSFENSFRDFNALGILDFTQTRAILKLVKDDENSRVVQEPALTMIDNTPGTIFVGETIPFAVQKVNVDQNGNATVTIDENKRSPINIGFTLYMVPHVIPGTDTVNLTVIPKVSTLTGTTSEIDGFDRFSFSQEQAGATSFIDLPRESAQTVVTSLRVHDGHTAVIGGLQTEKLIEIETKIPVLSTIPILGNVFTYRRRSNSVESLIIMITPHILKTVSQDDKISSESIEKHQRRDYFYQKYESDELPMRSGE